ncbi:inner membrane-spanning protein YciB [Pontixanthobacter aestiaquae]|uniref:Inner membrane-spanning protein YciB n=1 Tax=Pontixanthobacter aestiaquae TaxID=1509367 RepID=A0A844Z5V5_9SPHN|nr:inner membrane-spanning protein YciB [Pontixanthobacter aestiaquae]MDN3645698.1 inner membrane-spanning protein YciB [Pontixanthobacter aestiaquae]MXO83305.1 intracellular septation protein A [Pontixanthobacter aestiaquae]
MSDTQQTAKKPSGWLNVAVDYGPLLVFLGVYKYFAPEESEAIAEIAAVIKGTLAFMVAAVIALVFSKLKLGKVSPMLWFSTALIVGFGGLTIFFGDPTFVQLKPTIIYSLFGAALVIGWAWKGKALLKVLLEAAFEGLSDEGWLKLSRNWGFFFFALAGLNEVLRYLYNVENGTFETWLWAKFWVFMPLTFIFTFTQIPMLMKHGLDVGAEDDVIKNEPPTGS